MGIAYNVSKPAENLFLFGPNCLTSASKSSSAKKNVVREYPFGPCFPFVVFVFFYYFCFPLFFFLFFFFFFFFSRVLNFFFGLSASRFPMNALMKKKKHLFESSWGPCLGGKTPSGSLFLFLFSFVLSSFSFLLHVFLVFLLFSFFFSFFHCNFLFQTCCGIPRRVGCLQVSKAARTPNTSLTLNRKPQTPKP